MSLQRTNIEFSKLSYDSQYDSALLRGRDDPLTPRPWDLTQKIINLADDNKTLIDIGCGTAFKLLPLAKRFKHILGIEPSESMLEAARKNMEEYKNVSFIKAVGEQLPIKSQSIDVLTCMLSRWSVSEIQRVMKPSGDVIIEHIGCEDKKQFKLLFGKDESGLRGQYIDYNLPDFVNSYRSAFSKFFTYVEIKLGYWDTFYSEEGLMQLLQFTPTIRNFNVVKDRETVEKAIKQFSTGNGIKLTQHRIFIHAKNM